MRPDSRRYGSFVLDFPAFPRPSTQHCRSWSPSGAIPGRREALEKSLEAWKMVTFGAGRARRGEKMAQRAVGVRGPKCGPGFVVQVFQASG